MEENQDRIAEWQAQAAQASAGRWGDSTSLSNIAHADSLPDAEDRYSTTSSLKENDVNNKCSYIPQQTREGLPKIYDTRK